MHTFRAPIFIISTSTSPVQIDICRKRAAALRTACSHPGTLAPPQFLFHNPRMRLCKAEKLSMIPGRAMNVYVDNLIDFEGMKPQ